MEIEKQPPKPEELETTAKQDQANIDAWLAKANQADPKAELKLALNEAQESQQANLDQARIDFWKRVAEGKEPIPANLKIEVAANDNGNSKKTA